MLVIRLFRTGKKNQPSFKIVVVNKRKSSTKGSYVEELGNWNPLTKEKILRGERIKYWISVGAKPSPTVFNLLVSEKIIEGKKIDVHKKAKVKEEKPTEPAAPVPEVKPAGEKPKEEKPAGEKPKEEALEKGPKKEEKKEETPKEEKLKEKPKVEEKSAKEASKEKPAELEKSPEVKTE